MILRLGYPVEIISHTLLFYSIGVVALAIILYILQRRRLTRFAVAMVRQMDDVRRLLEGATTDPTAVFPELQPALEHIAYLAKRLNSDLAEINRTLSLRDDFVANASHELRSPLTSIMGFAEMLGEGLADTPEEQALCLQTIRGECERMLDVVEDVLLLSRAEREQGLTREHVVWNGWLRRCAARLRRRRRRRGYPSSARARLPYGPWKRTCGRFFIT